MRHGSFLFLLAVAAILFLLPLLGPSRSFLILLTAIGINAVFALSYNMLLGQTGLLSFGHAVYFGLGGYAAMHAMNLVEMGAYDGGYWATLPVFALPLIGFAAGAMAGAIIGFPSCRAAGVPFSMISFGIAELMAAAAVMFVSVFGGEDGITGDRTAGIQFFGLSLGPTTEVYWFILFWTFVAIAAMFAITRTPLGRMAGAVFDNGQRVAFMGYNPHRIRYVMFILAGGFAGLAGGMSAVNYEIFTPETFSIVPSGMVLLMAYIGGARHFFGPVLGAIALTYMQSYLSDYSHAWLLYLGVLFIIMVMFAPAGLAGLLIDVRNLVATGGIRARLPAWIRRGAGISVAAIGAIIVVELAIRLRSGEVFAPFGLSLDPTSIVPWIAGLTIASIGAFAMRRGATR